MKVILVLTYSYKKIDFGKFKAIFCTKKRIYGIKVPSL
jgi:hypothetical protein